jgi:microcystin-dependent protein
VSVGDFDVVHVKGDIDFNRLKPRNAILLQGSPGVAGEVVTSQGPGQAPTWAAGGGGGGAVASVFGRTGAVTAHSGDYTASEVGAVAITAEGVAGGVATLDGTGNVPLAQLGNAPSGGSGNVPVGGMILSVVAISDPNWLLCNGGTFSAATYPALNSFLGGNTLPDMRDQSPMGAHTTVALGANAGALTHTLTTAQLASHTHTGDAHTHTSAAHVHGSGGPHSHSHSHGPFSGTNFIEGGGGSTPIGTTTPGFTAASTTDTDATATDPGNTASTTPGATGGSSIGTTGGSGGGNSFSILSPVIGVDWYIRAA